MALRHSRMLELGTPAPAFALPDTAGRVWSLADFAASPALLVAFVCNHCPYVLHILDGFVAFEKEYRPRGLAVVGISPNDVHAYPQDAPPAMARLAAERGFGFPYLYDESQRTALAYQAICTPDFFLFDRERRLAYRGQFDGSRPGSGPASREPVSGRDLRTACDALLAGRPIPEPQIASAGCSIKWRPENAPDWA